MKSVTVSVPALVVAALFLCACTRSEAVTEPIRTFQMGERVNLAPLSYAIFEKQWATQFGTGTDARFPSTRFLLVRVSATNNGNADAFVPNMTLEDDAGNTCAELQDGSGAPNWIGYLRSVRPADTIQGNVLFDCAPKHYRLKLSNEDGKSAYVDLPLSFDTPDSNNLDMLKKEDSGGKLSHPK